MFGKKYNIFKIQITCMLEVRISPSAWRRGIAILISIEPLGTIKFHRKYRRILT